MVITGVADSVPERVAHLVYIDAQLPRDGEPEAEAVEADEWSQWQAIFREDGWRVNLTQGFDQTSGGPAPLRTLLRTAEADVEEGLHLGRPTVERSFERVYIAARDSAAPTGIARTKNNPAWRYLELKGGHVRYRDSSQERAAHCWR